MRTLALVALAAVVAVPLSGAAPTPTSDTEYTVIAHSKTPSVQTWKARLSNELDQRLASADRLNGYHEGFNEGFAVIEFRCGPDGRAQEIALVQSSKNRYVNRTAMRAIGKLQKLHPMPSELETGQKVRANIILAESDDGLDRELRNLRRATPPSAVAAIKRERVIVLNAGLRVQG